MANPTAIGLIRVSTADQALGLEAQRADIARFAAERGIDVLATISETVSGGAPIDKRVGLQRALEAVATDRASHLIVAKRDRLSRDPLVALMAEHTLEKVSATLLAADGNNSTDPFCEAMRGMLDVFARLERRLIGMRTKAALGVLKASGVKLGGRKPGARNKSYGGPRKGRSDKGKQRAELAR